MDNDKRKLLEDSDNSDVEKSERTSNHSSENSVKYKHSSLHSLDTVVFDTKLVKTSTQDGDLAATWCGRRSPPDSLRGRLRRTHSWSGGHPDDVSSEIRILRERLVRTQTRLRPGAVRNLSKKQRLTLASLALVDFMSFCSMSIMAPFFPREAEVKGLSDTTCGMVFSFYAIVMFVTSPFFGKFGLGSLPLFVWELGIPSFTILLTGNLYATIALPALGTKFMFISGMLVAGGCNVLFGTLAMIEDTTTFTVLCFVVRGLEALGASAYSTASYVFVVNAFPESIGSVLGILETFVGLGMSVGPAIGGLLYSIGGFGLPFYCLGIVMVLTVPINFWLLTDCEEYVSGSKTGSILRLFKIPSIIITGLVIVIVSNTWAFLDPTLEPHLRQFGLSTNQIGLIFLLFSSLYGIFSPIWGWVADRVHNHWCMMVWGLFLSSVGLILLGPCPFIPGLPQDLWLDLVALSILGMSVALTLLPTFQGVLTSSIYEGGCPEALATYSAVAGVWSCCYSLGEVLGPALGGALAQRYGFPLCATLCAAACFTMAVVTLTFFSLRESEKWILLSEEEDSIPYTDSTWSSENFVRSRSAPASKEEISPLLTPCSCQGKHNGLSAYGTNAPSRKLCLHNKRKSGYATVADGVAYFLKFQYITDAYVKIRRRSKPRRHTYPNTELYQDYLKKERRAKNSDMDNNNLVPKRRVSEPKRRESYCEFLENIIFGSPAVLKNMDSLTIKRNNKGLVAKLKCDDERKPTDDIIRHNLEKIQFYEQTQPCMSMDDIFDGCECRDGVTYVRGTVTVSSTGACEV